MPFLSIATSLLAAGVFCAGGLVAWFIVERRHAARRVLLERSMTRALEERYLVYQELEASIYRLFSRLDQLEAEWAVRARPAVPQHSIIRVENPELWDLECEFERRQAEQLAEISEKSQRVAQLMTRIQALEPLSRQLAERDREYVQLEETHRALEEARRARVTEREQRIRELEPTENEADDLRARLDAANGELEVWRDRAAGLEEQLARARVAAEERAAQAAALEKVVADRDGRTADFQEKVDALKAELEVKSSQVFMRDELLKEREKDLAEVEEELEHTRAERDRKIEELTSLQVQLQAIETSWREASGEVEQQRSKLAEHLSTFESAQLMLSQLKPLISELEHNLHADDARITESRADEPTTGETSDEDVLSEELHVDEILIEAEAEGAPEEILHPDELEDPFDFVDRTEVDPAPELDAPYEGEIQAGPNPNDTVEPPGPLPAKAPRERAADDFDLSFLDEEGRV